MDMEPLPMQPPRILGGKGEGAPPATTNRQP